MLRISSDIFFVCAAVHASGASTNTCFGQSLGRTWTYTNKKGSKISFKFDKASGTFEFSSGGDSTQGTYTAEPFTMLDMRLYEDDFESDGYEVLLPVKFIDESTFTTSDGEVYKKAVQ